jgi:curli production assembly/transport component CsgG
MFDDPRFNLWGTIGKFNLGNKDSYYESFLASGLNIEYNFLPYEKFTPFIYAGVGSFSSKGLDQTFLKLQGGVGLEYLITNKVGFFLKGEYNMMLTDDLDRQIVGEKDDLVWRFGAGINIYF